MGIGRCSSDKTLAGGEAEVVYGFDSVVAGDGLRLGGLAVVCFHEDVSMLVDDCVTKMEFFGAQYVIRDEVDDLKLEGTYGTGAVETHNWDF